ncbi:MAG TPA: hypothetical protein VES67_03845 [Vicinamibacterales bacterium]|nr:hypothetical protein [Vicinamibacterales bacterium]
MTLRLIVAFAVLPPAVAFALIVASIVVGQLLRGGLSPEVSQLWFGWRGALRAILLGLWVGTTAAMLFWAIGVRGNEREWAKVQQA